MSFFGFRDDGLRTGFQAALQRADGTPRPAVAAVRDAIVETASGCVGASRVWSPSDEVLGGASELRVSSSGVAVITAVEEARATACVAVATRGIGGSGFRALRLAPRCRTAYVGPGSLAMPLPLPVGEDVRGRVTVELAARSNPSRRTLVEHETPTLR